MFQRQFLHLLSLILLLAAIYTLDQTDGSTRFIDLLSVEKYKEIYSCWY